MVFTETFNFPVKIWSILSHFPNKKRRQYFFLIFIQLKMILFFFSSYFSFVIEKIFLTINALLFLFLFNCLMCRNLQADE